MFDIKIKPIVDSLTAEKVMFAGREDGHLVLQPNFLVEKNQEIIGAISLGNLPVVSVWMSASKSIPRDCITMMVSVENIARSRGLNILMPLVTPSSPFKNIVEKFGYSQLTTTTLNYKLL